MKKEIYYYDYLKIAEELDISQESLEKIEQEVKAEFPSDPLLFELHMLRILQRERLVSQYSPKEKDTILRETVY